MTIWTNFFKSSLASVWGGITCLTPVAIASELPVAQTSPPPISDLAQEVVSEITQCLFENTSNPQATSQKQLETVAMRCFYQVIIIAPEGGIRPDAEARLKEIVTLTGISLPQKVSQGEASLQLQSLTDTGIFTVPVSIKGQSQDFLFDTGASSSVVDTGLAEKLGLDSTPIPNDMLEYMVVGDSCEDITASIHNLPPLAVDQASVKGILSIGLPKTNIPGDVAGVLGLDFLSNFDLNFNPQTQTLKLSPPSTFQANGISLQGKMGVMIAQVTINGQGPYDFLLDTGAGWVVVSEDLAQKLAITAPGNEEIEVRGFCGTEKGQRVTLKQVAIQSHQQQNLDAVVIKSEVLQLLGVDGIIGQNFLNQYQQYWQFSPPNELGFPNTGSLLLKPIN